MVAVGVAVVGDPVGVTVIALTTTCPAMLIVVKGLAVDAAGVLHFYRGAIGAQAIIALVGYTVVVLIETEAQGDVALIMDSIPVAVIKGGKWDA